MIYHPHLTTLCETIAFHARTQPDAEAVRTLDGAVSTYRQLDTDSDRVASALQAAGYTPGTRVAYLGRESEVYWEVLFGAAKAGIVLVPVNWRLATDEVDHILTDSGAALVFLDFDHPLRGQTGCVEIVLGGDYGTWRDTHAESPLAVTVTPETPLAQLYTSGTTGLPKGVVLAHRSFFAIRNALGDADLDWIDWHPNDVALIGIPGFHVGGLWYATQAFHAGATVVSTAIFDATRVRAAFSTLQVTAAIFVPSMMRSLLAEPGVTPSDFASLRKIVYGGAPIAETLLERCTQTFGCEFAQIYGLTETGNTAICLPPDQHVIGSERLRAAGRPYPTVEVRIVDKDGVELPQGYVGEVLLRTPAAMLEYWRLPEATAETLVDGWIRTGDAGYLDNEGYLYIQDRVKDMILVGGENVYPAEVENALLRHPRVADAAVIGVPDDAAGESVLAHIALEPGPPVSTRELRRFLVERLAPFKLPARYVFVDEIPRNPSGKILRRQLREEHWQGRERQVN